MTAEKRKRQRPIGFVVGLLVGMGCFAGGAFAMLRNYRFLSQGLVGAAMGIIYLTGGMVALINSLGAYKSLDE